MSGLGSTTRSGNNLHLRRCLGTNLSSLLAGGLAVVLSELSEVNGCGGVSHGLHMDGAP
jgi:hypothetical protein